MRASEHEAPGVQTVLPAQRHTLPRQCSKRACHGAGSSTWQQQGAPDPSEAPAPAPAGPTACPCSACGRIVPDPTCHSSKVRGKHHHWGREAAAAAAGGSCLCLRTSAPCAPKGCCWTCMCPGTYMAYDWLLSRTNATSKRPKASHGQLDRKWSLLLLLAPRAASFAIAWLELRLPRPSVLATLGPTPSASQRSGHIC